LPSERDHVNVRGRLADRWAEILGQLRLTKGLFGVVAWQKVVAKIDIKD